MSPPGCRGRRKVERRRPRAPGIVGLVLVLAALPAAPAPAGDDDLALGRSVFVEQAAPQCGICHALADAGSAGEVGPDLDELKPTAEQVAKAVADGIEAMPAYRGVLDEDAIAAVAAYVAAVAGR